MRNRQSPISLHRQLTLRSRARRMRHAPTASEQILWLRLRGKQLCGVQFRRQVPLLGRYVVDLYASSVGLIVEVDGAYHSERLAADATRDRALRRAEYQVLRLSEGLVKAQPEEAVARVRERLLELKNLRTR